MNELVVPFQPQGDDGAVGRVLTQQNVPYVETLGTLLGLVLGFAVVYIVGKAVASSALNRVPDWRSADEHAKKPLMKIATLVMTLVALGAGFAFVGLGNILRLLVTIDAVATLVVGFAIQGIAANFVAGIFTFTDKPFCINDWIEQGGNAGAVEDTSSRVTHVRIFDNELLTVPDPQLTDGVTKNPVAKDRLRLQVPFGIGYGDDIQQATDIILDKAENHEGIIATPEPLVRLIELGDSSVTLKSRIWISQPSRADFVKTRGEYATTVKERFDEEDIDIPYPNRALSGELSVGSAEHLMQPND